LCNALVNIPPYFPPNGFSRTWPPNYVNVERERERERARERERGVSERERKWLRLEMGENTILIIGSVNIKASNIMKCIKEWKISIPIKIFV
jgi:hypothetical protein